MTAPLASHSFSPSYHVEVGHELETGYSRALRSSVVEALEGGRSAIVVDCAGWRELDFGVLSALIQCANTCRSRGATFEVVNLSREMQASIRALRLDGRLGLQA